MSEPDNSQTLDTCGCCETETAAPAHENRPGLPAMAYRLGTHSSFLRRMLARLPLHTLPDSAAGSPAERPLLALTTRQTSDPAIALLDAWASVSDVLTFYQERLANEGYLRTATERRSVLELARAIGYELKPGVAASTYLAFTVEDATGAPGQAAIDTGVRVLSIPAQNQKPQTFETIESIEARKEWNTLTPRQTRPQDLPLGATQLYLKGIASGLAPGDPLLLVGSEREAFPGSESWDVRILKTVTTYPKANYTLVTWDLGLGEWPSLPAENPKAYAFRLRTSLFGHNAAQWDNLPDEIKALYFEVEDGEEFPSEWPDFAIQDEQIDLESNFPKVLPGSWVALLKPSYIELYKATGVTFISRTGFGLVSKITRVKPDAREHLSWFGLRQTTVLAQSELLELVEEPIPDPVQGDTIALDRWVAGLEVGRRLIFSGQRMRARLATTSPALALVSSDGLRSVTVQPGDSLIVTQPPEVETGGTRWYLVDRDGFTGSVLVAGNVLSAAGSVGLEPALADDAPVSEVAVISAVSSDQERTTLTLADPLQNDFDRATVVIYANVALATHGETVKDEVLGSGDGSQSNQRFSLKKPPLTYISAAAASGVESTLTARLNGVAWEAASSLYGLEARDKVYLVHVEDDGKTIVTFGDGISGARLPSGSENVKATYRSGIGLAGEVDANSLTLLQTRPFGVRSVTNPLAASGAADPESRDAARTNAPITVLTLDRIVSLRDFEDFTRAFAGVGKAQAVALWNGEINLVHLTVATAAGDPLDPDSDLYTNLRAAIDAARDPNLPVVVQGHQLIRFRLEAKVLVDEKYVFEDVIAAIESALAAAFEFDNRAFGQAVTAAEVTTIIQAEAGVIAVDLDTLYLDGATPALNAVLPAVTARLLNKTAFAAQLLLINPYGITLTEMTP